MAKKSQVASWDDLEYLLLFASGIMAAFVSGLISSWVSGYLFGNLLVDLYGGFMWKLHQAIVATAWTNWLSVGLGVAIYLASLWAVAWALRTFGKIKVNNRLVVGAAFFAGVMATSEIVAIMNSSIDLTSNVVLSTATLVSFGLFYVIGWWIGRQLTTRPRSKARA